MEMQKEELNTSQRSILEDKSQNQELGNTLNMMTQMKYNHIKKDVRIKEDLAG